MNLHHCNSYAVLLHYAVDSLSVWASINELMFQPAKCENLRITRKRCSPQRSYTLNKVTLKLVTIARDLGLQVSHDLLWADHIAVIVSKANRMLGFLRRHCSKGVPCHIQKTLYISLVITSYLCQPSMVTLSAWIYLFDAKFGGSTAESHAFHLPWL